MATQIYSSAALRTRQREVKDAALKDIVHITENGNGAFVFCSEEVFDRSLKEAVDQALYEYKLANAIRSSRADIAEGRSFEGTDLAFSEADRRRGSLG